MSNNAKPIRIGVLIDFPMIDAAKRVMFDAFNLAFDEALEGGLIDRPIEFVVREFLGVLRGGGYAEALQAWKEVAAEGVVGIYGPLVSENALVIGEYNNAEPLGSSGSYRPTVAARFQCGNNVGCLDFRRTNQSHARDL